MQLACYELTATRSLQPIAAARPSSHWRTADVVRWVDVEAASADELGEFFADLELHPLVRERCLDPRQGARFGAYDEMVMVDVPLRQPGHGSELLEIVVLAFPSLLVTVHAHHAPRMPAVASELSAAGSVCTARVPGLLYSLLDRMTEMQVQWYLTLREEVASLEDAVDEGDAETDVDSIAAVRRSVRQLGDLVEDQAACIQFLRSARAESFRIEDERDYYASLAGGLRDASRSIARLIARVRDVHDAHQGFVQETTSARLRMLTVLSAVYLPATLIAGIYGMNFENIPILDWRYGYGAVVAIMATIVAGQLVYFTRRGWFR